MEVLRLVADMVNPFYMGIWKWLRNRRWFWPPALWAGLKWAITLSSHPVARVAEIVVALLTLFGVALVIHHADPFFILLFALVLFLMIWAKGVRLKWLSDLERRTSSENPEATPPMQLPSVPHEVRQIEKGRTIIRPISDDEAKKMGGESVPEGE